MRARSWMAALAVITGCSIAAGRVITAQTPGGTAPQENKQERINGQSGAKAADRGSAPKPSAALIPAVQLNLAIAGLGREGCDVEVKPGNASCKFRVVNTTDTGEVFKKGADGPQHVSSAGFAHMELRNVELRGADRMFTVAITVREPGQTTKTVFRGFRLPARTEKGASATSGKIPAFTCYLNSPSKIARLDDAGTRK